MNPRHLLAIESSCDETSAAVVRDDRGTDYRECAGSQRVVRDDLSILSNIVLSQDEIHAPYGGVVPELASRQHLKAVTPVVRESLATAGLPLAAMDFFAVTQGPGLIGSLLVGLSFAKGLAYYYRKPVLGIDHVQAHIESAFIDRPDLVFPALALVVSGGHTSLFLMKKKLRYQVIGRTRDDAAGEALDKIAKFLELGYPGGPIIQKLAENGDPGRFPFGLPRMSDRSLDFSFSGLKTAAIRIVRENGIGKDSASLPDFLASFESAVVRALLGNIIRATEIHSPKSLVLGGGVARNKRLRAAFEKAAAERGLPFALPTPKLCTDNAAMIGALAWAKIKAAKKKIPLSQDLDAYPRSPR
ncbi:MAG: tRNA (adenosine(37)-N6)-threonylcarbamoyltransferase complex transferase subunit TsaD [Candidatus Aminicenantes bacterium]|nr:tRNA (adenosine(37)-N6)-threonylcarbamoyltransferase complex transferase subunit TsaD [Candidatus Aminicenantes bacterium]